MLGVAAAVIAERGLDDTRFADVAQAAGVSISTLQYFFGVREDLLLAAVEYAMQDERQRLGEIVASESQPGERLAQLTTLALGQDERAERARRLRVEVCRAAMHHAELRAIYQEIHENWLAAVRDTLHDGIQHGLFPRSISAADAGAQILGVIEGLALPLLLDNASFDPDRAQHLATEVIRAMLHADPPLSGVAS